MKTENINVAWRRKEGKADKLELLSLKPIKAGQPLILGVPIEEGGDLSLHFVRTGNLDTSMPAKANVYITLDSNCPHYDIKRALLLDSAN